MSELSIKFIHEQQKNERQMTANTQLSEQLRDLHKMLKVSYVQLLIYLFTYLLFD